MATIDLGKIKQVWRGTYASGTAYTPDDVVEYTDSGILSSYICIANTTGNAPSSSGTAHGSWNYLAKGGVAGTNGTDLTSTLGTQGQILYRDGSGLAALNPGTSGQALLTGGASANPSWGTVGGGLLKSDYSTYSTVKTHTTAYTNISSSVSFTPTSASSDLIIQYSTLAYMNGGTGIGIKLMIGGSEVGTNMWASNSYMTAYSGSGTDYVSVNVFTKYDNTSTSAKTIEVQGRRYDNSTNVYSQYDGRPSQLLIMEIGV